MPVVDRQAVLSADPVDLIGAALMAAGGFLSLSSGRLLASLRRPSQVSAQPHAIPAE
jgi:hypothetical protein